MVGFFSAPAVNQHFDDVMLPPIVTRSVRQTRSTRRSTRPTSRPDCSTAFLSSRFSRPVDTGIPGRDLLLSGTGARVASQILRAKLK
jgi:hypothetical protein